MLETTYRKTEKALNKAGWYTDRQKGSHKQLRHPVIKGTVTLAGKPNETLYAEMMKGILKQAGLTEDQFRKCLEDI